MAWLDGTPKHELHIHFGGAIPYHTTWQLLQDSGIVKYSKKDVKDLTTCRNNDNRNFHTFLSKFELLNEIQWTPVAIAKSVEQVMSSLKNEQVDYAEITFSIDKYVNGNSKFNSWGRHDFIDFIYGVFNHYSSALGVKVGLVLSLKMESGHKNRIANLNLIAKSSTADKLIGIDLVGNECHFCYDYYEGLLKDWKSAKKLVLVHAGEVATISGPIREQNVHDAIVKLKADRIRHGIAIANQPYLLQLANDHNVCFDMSLHSNYWSGAVSDLKSHPLPKFLAAGCNVTLGTDDPAVFSITLHDEYDTAFVFDLATREQIQVMKLNAIKWSALGESRAVQHHT